MPTDFKNNIPAGKKGVGLEAYFRVMYEYNPIGIVMTSTKGTLIGNRAVCKMLGYTQAELLQLSAKEITYVDDQFIHNKQYKKLIKGEIDTFSIEKRYVKKDGSFIWCQVTLVLVNDEQKGIETRIAYLQDIHEKKITNIALDNISKNLTARSAQAFFNSFVTSLSKNLNVPFVFVGNYNALKSEISTASFWAKDKIIDYNYILEGTPCNDVIKNEKELCIIKGVQKNYPKDIDLVELNIEGYYGSPLFNTNGEVFGHIAIMDEKPLKNLNLLKSIVKIYSTRIGAELERYKNELALKRSEAKYRSISDNNLLGIAVTDATFKFTEVNPAFCQMFDYTEAELLSMSVVEITSPESAEKSRRLNKKLKGGVIPEFTLDKTYIKKDGSQIHAITSVKGIYNSEGNFKSAVATVQDITEKKIITRAINNILESLTYRSSEAFFTSLVKGIAENLNISYVVIGKYDEKNKSVTSSAFWAKGNLGDYHYSLDNSPCKVVIEEEKELYIIDGIQEAFPLYKDLEKLKIQGYFSVPVFDSKNNVVGNIVLMDDKPLTNLKLLRTLVNIYNTRIGAELERQKNESELKRSEAKYRSISDNNLLGIVVTDATFKFTEVNPAFCQMLGYTKEELLQKTIGDISDEKDKEKSIRMSERIANRELEAFSFQKAYIRKDGGKIFAHTSAKGTYDNDGNFIGCIATIQNITERVKAKRSLEQKNTQLKKYIDSNMQLENFAYIASHDMKQPLRTIGNFTGLLQNRLKDKLDKNTSDYMTFILEAVKEMSQLIEDLLLYSSVKQEHQNEEINLTLLLEQLTKIIDQDIKNYQAKIEFSNIPTKIIGNPTKLKQLFQNLIINAVKFKKPSQTPTVKISAKNKKDYWQFSVKDNGIGISEEFHETVFLLFKKLHGKSDYEGTGIGLALCKKIVEQHGGEIWINSILNKGTTFHFTISKKLPTLNSLGQTHQNKLH